MSRCHGVARSRKRRLGLQFRKSIRKTIEPRSGDILIAWGVSPRD
jgi:hypothetical protein